MGIKLLIFIKRHARGYGKDEVGDYILTGALDQGTSEVSLEKKYIGQHTVLYRGRLNVENNKIVGKWSFTDHS